MLSKCWMGAEVEGKWCGKKSLFVPRDAMLSASDVEDIDEFCEKNSIGHVYLNPGFVIHSKDLYRLSCTRFVTLVFDFHLFYNAWQYKKLNNTRVQVVLPKSFHGFKEGQLEFKTEEGDKINCYTHFNTADIGVYSLDVYLSSKGEME